MSADCPAGATSAKAYKDHVDSGAACIVDGKITKTFSNIEVGVSHLYGLSALHDDVESAITEEEYTVPAMHIDPFIFGANNITGTYSGDVKKGKLYVNNSYAGVIGGTFKEGKFSFYARGKFLATDKVELEGLDGSDIVVVEKQRVEIINQ
ncbi:immunoglobulin-like domain-containing protein [Enterococcus faecium]